jgi:transcriptional regulator with XRE-family HTH domain
LTHDALTLQALLASLRERRLAQNISPSDIVKQGLLDRTTLYRLENGLLANPTVSTIQSYAQAVGATVHWGITFHAQPDNTDGEQGEFQSIWNFSGRDRALASRIICFLASPRSFYADVYTKHSDFAEITDLAATDDTVLYRWSVSSPSVDRIAEVAWVRPNHLQTFLDQHRFDRRLTKNPDRAARERWLHAWTLTNL